jgi:hypothetical protein
MQADMVVKRAAPVAALSIEFVAKPGEAPELHGAIPAALRDGLSGVPGFVGCIVMISDREARLINVVTFWDGAERVTCRSKREPWVLRLLARYMDRCLRIQTLDAYLPALTQCWSGGELLPGWVASGPAQASLCVG